MKTVHAPKALADGNVEPAHEIEILCAECGYDVNGITQTAINLIEKNQANENKAFA